jgi:hypothetical protein
MNQASPQTINQTIHKQLINQTIDQTTVGKQSKAVRSTNQSINQIQNQSDTDPISTHVNLKDETLSNQAIHQWIDESSKCSNIQQTIQSRAIDQSCDRPMNQSKNGWINNEWINNEWIKQWMNQTTNQYNNSWSVKSSWDVGAAPVGATTQLPLELRQRLSSFDEAVWRTNNGRFVTGQQAARSLILIPASMKWQFFVTTVVSQDVGIVIRRVLAASRRPADSSSIRMTAPSSTLMISPPPRFCGRLDMVYGILGLAYVSTIAATRWMVLLEGKTQSLEYLWFLICMTLTTSTAWRESLWPW